MHNDGEVHAELLRVVDKGMGKPLDGKFTIFQIEDIVDLTNAIADPDFQAPDRRGPIGTDRRRRRG